MRIALIAGATIPGRTANSVQVMKMSQAFTSLGHDLRMYVPGHDPDIDWQDLAVHYGLEQSFTIHWIADNPRLRRYDFALGAVRQARSWGADLIYTRLPQAAAVASWRGYPTIFEAHDLPRGRLGPRLLRIFLQGRGARRLAPITQALSRELARHYSIPSAPGFVQVAPDGVDLGRYTGLPTPPQAREALGLPQGFTAGYTGHLYKGRGVGLIMELAALLPHISFLFVGGEHKDVDYWQGQAKETGLKNVTLAGFQPNAELPLYQAACNVLLMPYQENVAISSGTGVSRYYSPMKMFEYLACARPILSSDQPVLQEILSPQNAVILPAADVQAWAAAIQKVQADPKYAQGLAAQARATAGEYTWGKRAAAILRGLST
jgi:glycosyltransferase involved in cell wall biosynthesis